MLEIQCTWLKANYNINLKNVAFFLPILPIYLPIYLPCFYLLWSCQVPNWSMKQYFLFFGFLVGKWVFQDDLNVPFSHVLKGTVSSISRDPPWKYGNVQFTTVPFKALFKCKLDIHVLNLENWLFSILDSLKNGTAEKRIGIISIKHF